MAAGWNRDRKLSEAHKRRISEANRGKKLSEDTKQKIALALTGNKHALGLRHTEQSKEKMSLGNKGQIPWNKGIKAWNNGQRWPDEVKENISRGMVAYWMDRKELESKTQIV